MNLSEFRLYFCTIVPIKGRWCNRLWCCRNGCAGHPAALILTMTDLMQIISNGAANIKLEITGEDLRIFSDELINRAINEVALAFRAADEERLLSREEVKDMCGVCDATLWHWNKRNYLKAVKVGSKVRYRLSDVKRILGGTNKVGSNGGK